MELALNIASWVCILAGSFFYVVGSAGLLRMPDVFSRMHAASVSDTTGASLLLIGMMFQAGVSLVLAKLFMLWFFILFTGPVATHALARAARYAGVEPVLATSSTPQLEEKAETDVTPTSKDTPAKKTTAKKKTSAKSKSTKAKTNTQKTSAKKAPAKRKSTTRGKAKP
ncbi:MAG: monovalent cation/H(+) antiporter subunit G [Hyphomicrobiales bacterium]